MSGSDAVINGNRRRRPASKSPTWSRHWPSLESLVMICDSCHHQQSTCLGVYNGAICLTKTDTASRDFIPMKSAVHIESLPKLSEFLSEFLCQLQLTGLFAAHLGLVPDKSAVSFFDGVWPRRDFLYKLATMLEGYIPGELKVLETPAISNTIKWNCGNALGGYAGKDIPVTLSNLLASYLGCWRHALMFPAFVFQRFLRLGYWYWRERGDVFDALELLFDMYRAGFFLRMQDVGSAVIPLCHAYTTGIDLEDLWALDFSSETIDAAIILKAAESFQKPHMENRVQLLVDWVSNRALDELDLAHKAANVDEWLIRRAWVGFSADFLTGLEKIHAGRLASSQRAIVSQFEEMRCDLGWIAASDRARGKCGSTFVVDLSLVDGLGSAYQGIYGAGWLDKLAEDRLLFPDVLHENVQAAYAGAPIPSVRKITIPRKWAIASESIGWALSALFKRNLLHERSADFDDGLVVATCREGGHAPESGKGDDPEDFSEGVQSRARDELAGSEFQEMLWGRGLFSKSQEVAIKGFEEMSELYPWNYSARRELGIRYDEVGETQKAYHEMRAAVLLNPCDAIGWHSLSIILDRINSPRDAKFAEGIAKACEAGQL